jgi:hypothetical protein
VTSRVERRAIRSPRWPIYLASLVIILLAGCGLLGGNSAEARAREFFAALQAGDVERAAAMYRRTGSSSRPEDRVLVELQVSSIHLNRSQIKDVTISRTRIQPPSPEDRSAGLGDTHTIGMEYAFRLSKENWRPGIFVVVVQEVEGQYVVVDWQ